MPAITISFDEDVYEKLNDPMLRKSAMVNEAMKYYFKRDELKIDLWGLLMRDFYLNGGLTEEQKAKVLEIAEWTKKNL